MRHESEHDDLHPDLHDDLHDALGAAVATLVIGASPTADVMRDGMVRRRRRRLAVTSGVAALAVLPVAAVAVFAGGAGAGTKSGAVSPAQIAGKESPNPPPIVVPTPLPAPGKLNPDLPNDSIVVLASGTADGKHWRLVRDRYVVAGPEPANAMGDPSTRPHLPYAANWDKPGTIECDFTGIQWGDDVPGGDSRLSGGACNPVDLGSITRILGRFGESGDSGSSRQAPPSVWGRIDGTDVAYMSMSIDDWYSGKQPVIQVPGETNDYYVIMVPRSPGSYKRLTTTLYDAHGMVLGTQDNPSIPIPHPAMSPSAEK